MKTPKRTLKSSTSNAALLAEGKLSLNSPTAKHTVEYVEDQEQLIRTDYDPLLFLMMLDSSAPSPWRPRMQSFDYFMIMREPRLPDAFRHIIRKQGLTSPLYDQVLQKLYNSPQGNLVAEYKKQAQEQYFFTYGIRERALSLFPDSYIRAMGVSAPSISGRLPMHLLETLNTQLKAVVFQDIELYQPRTSDRICATLNCSNTFDLPIFGDHLMKYRAPELAMVDYLGLDEHRYRPRPARHVLSLMESLEVVIFCAANHNWKPLCNETNP